MGPHHSGGKGRQTGRRMSKFMLERSNARHHRSTNTGTTWNDCTKSQASLGVPVERGHGTEGGFSPPFRRSVPILSLVWNAERRPCKGRRQNVADGHETREARAHRYRVLTSEAEVLAVKASTDETRKAYRELAQGWHDLAEETIRRN